MPQTTKMCPYCASTLNKDQWWCPHCHRDLASTRGKAGDPDDPLGELRYKHRDVFLPQQKQWTKRQKYTWFAILVLGVAVVGFLLYLWAKQQFDAIERHYSAASTQQGMTQQQNTLPQHHGAQQHHSVAPQQQGM
ncbi:MAG TPA: hypothetical protein V6D17_18450 [Candidatus Obscuribacterales bacterium]